MREFRQKTRGKFANFANSSLEKQTVAIAMTRPVCRAHRERSLFEHLPN
jgi:hypothetical protein